MSLHSNLLRWVDPLIGSVLCICIGGMGVIPCCWELGYLGIRRCGLLSVSRAHTNVAITFSQKGKNEAGQDMTKTSSINLVDLAGRFDVLWL